MDFRDRLKEYIKFVDGSLDKIIPSENEYPQVIYKAVRYSVFAGGKRIRPILLLEACNMFGGDINSAVPFACALELIHTYSLIHDDLPAMDNDDLRRGKPTNHKAFGENIAILAGDACLNMAFEILSQACVESGNKRSLMSMREIAASSGIKGMLGGQTVDVISEGIDIDADTLKYIHMNKTAALIKCALKAGAILGGAEDEDIKIIETAGENIGLSFQIQDDILDVLSTTEELGKPVLSDVKNEKTTYATLYGIDKSKKTVKELTAEGIELLKATKKNTEFLAWLSDFMVTRKY